MELSTSQRKVMLDMVSQLVAKKPISDDYINDKQVVAAFLFYTQDIPATTVDFLTLVPVSRWSFWTELDILTEEHMVQLHVDVGFKATQMVAWLRGLSFGSVGFFQAHATQQRVNHVNEWVFKSRYNPRLIDGVYIDEIPKYFDSLSKLIDVAIQERITIKQYRNVLAQLSPKKDDLHEAIQMLIKDHHAFKTISSSDDVLVFRICVSLMDFLDDFDVYMPHINRVIDELLVNSTTQKALGLLNLMPYGLIELFLRRFIDANDVKVVPYLNNALPHFEFGAIRKIVRRANLGLNYNHDKRH